MRFLLVLLLLTGCGAEKSPRYKFDSFAGPGEWVKFEQTWKVCVEDSDIGLDYCSNDLNDPQIEFWKDVLEQDKKTAARMKRKI